VLVGLFLGSQLIGIEKPPFQSPTIIKQAICDRHVPSVGCVVHFVFTNGQPRPLLITKVREKQHVDGMLVLSGDEGGGIAFLVDIPPDPGGAIGTWHPMPDRPTSG
jgi:hypothetical protein